MTPRSAGTRPPVAAAPRRRARPWAAPATGAARSAGDAGITLIEVVTAMSIMSVFMALFTAGILQIYHFTNRNESVSTVRSQVDIAFVRLEKEIRYASAISAPGAIGTDQYVEYLVTSSGTPTCVGLRLHAATRQLQRRQWQQGESPAADAWRVLASGVSSPQAFTVSAADATFDYQRLGLDLTANAGSGRSAASAQVSVTFTALNTSADTPNDAVCTDARGTP